MMEVRSGDVVAEKLWRCGLVMEVQSGDGIPEW